jgi:O-antigen/teichoic acid export membrane protein
MISKSFLKSSFIFTLGGALPMVASIILLPFYANLLGDTGYAQVLFYINISLLFQILFSFSLESYFGIEYSRLHHDPIKQKKFIGTVSLMLLFIGAGLLLISSLVGEYLFSQIFRSELNINFWPYGFYSILTAFFNSYFKAATVSLIYLKKAGLFFVVNIVNFVATIAISIGGLYLFPGTIVGPIYGRLLSGAIIFLMAYFIFSKHGQKVFDRSFLDEIVKFCTPFLVFSISGWTLTQIDKFILQEHVDFTDLNAYDLVTKCFFGIEFVQNSLSAIIYPKLYEIWAKNGDNRTTKESNRYFNVFTAINIMQLILFCIFIPIIYHLLIKREGFHRAEAYIGLLASGYALRSILNFYVSTILYSKRISILLKIFGVSALIQIGASWLGVKYFGVLGAIYAALIIKILQVPLSIIFTRKLFVYEYNRFKILLMPFLYIAINILQFIF